MFSERLKKELERNNISQTRLSSDIGFSQVAVSKWCNGLNEPDYATLKTLANKLNVTTDYLCPTMTDNF